MFNNSDFPFHLGIHQLCDDSRAQVLSGPGGWEISGPWGVHSGCRPGERQAGADGEALRRGGA